MRVESRIKQDKSEKISYPEEGRCVRNRGRYLFYQTDGGRQMSAVGENVPVIRISVRNLVEFILREGDIDNRISGGPDKDAMIMGGRIHRKIQRKMGPEYQAEVSLKTEEACDGFVILVEGRADGIITERDEKGIRVTVDEIKGVLRDIHFIEKPDPLHLAQAKCYAAVYAGQKGLETIGVQITYCQMESEEIRRFTETYEADELKEWFRGLIGKYEKWARFEIEWKKTRNESIRETEFPFSYREGQRDMAAAVYRTILRKKKLFIQASTGVGKTISTVFPSVKALGEGIGEKIFYLTAKTITRTVAEQAFGALEDNGLMLKVLTLTAKEKICFCEETECNPEKCPFAKGHYDRVNDAVYDLLTGENGVSRQKVEEYAKKHRVCPFEMALDLSVWADAVICDYNYVFDPNAHLKRFFSEGGNKGYIFLIDEAHNLVERGREMFSAVLYKEDFLELKRIIKDKDKKMAALLEGANRLFLALKRESAEYRVLESISHISLKLMQLLTEMERFLEEEESSEEREKVLELYFQVRSFLNIYDITDENYVTYSEMEADGRFKLKLFCINPASNLQSFLEQGNGTVFFSATLLPVRYYKNLLSVEEDDYAIYVESSFPKENRLILLGRDVSTKYTRRGPEMYRRIAGYILTAAQCRTGNYIAFFPSYKMLDEVYSFFLKECKDMQSAAQEQHMGEREREEFLELFEQKRTVSFVGFCVMGGIFSEGIDLADDRLIGAVVVGTGLPQVCSDREIIRNFFDGKNRKGFDYSYLYPGMNKVLQSAGRVIRTENDRGVILLLDDRFLDRRYREIFPREWTGVQTCTLPALKNQLEEFWK